jgi:hypothetical protein
MPVDLDIGESEAGGIRLNHFRFSGWGLVTGGIGGKDRGGHHCEYCSLFHDMDLKVIMVLFFMRL